MLYYAMMRNVMTHYVPPKEFMGEETPLEKLFKSMDKDGDGTVTKEVGRFFVRFSPKSQSFPIEFMSVQQSHSRSSPASARIWPKSRFRKNYILAESLKDLH